MFKIHFQKHLANAIYRVFLPSPRGEIVTKDLYILVQVIWQGGMYHCWVV